MTTTSEAGRAESSAHSRTRPSELRYRWAINHALAEEMRRDDAVVLLGQDIGVFGGDFGVTRGLIDEFGPSRVVDTPISETAIVGAAVGAALAGLRPVAEMAFADFMVIAGDETFYKGGKWRYEHGDDFSVPMVIRAGSGVIGGAGAEHSSCLEPLMLHFPGIKAVAPATVADAKGMLKAAIRDPNPVVFFEHKGLYNTKGPLSDDEEHLTPLHGARVVREGSHATIAAYGLMVHRSLEAADALAAEGHQVEVIDLRSIVPLDCATVIDSVKKTSRLLTVEESPRIGGIGAEIAARVSEEAFHYLDAPISRLGALHVPTPFSPGLEEAVIPSVTQIRDALLRLLS